MRLYRYDQHTLSAVKPHACIPQNDLPTLSAVEQHCISFDFSSTALDANKITSWLAHAVRAAGSLPEAKTKRAAKSLRLQADWLSRTQDDLRRVAAKAFNVEAMSAIYFEGSEAFRRHVRH